MPCMQTIQDKNSRKCYSIGASEGEFYIDVLYSLSLHYLLNAFQKYKTYYVELAFTRPNAVYSIDIIPQNIISMVLLGHYVYSLSIYVIKLVVKRP